MVRTKGPHKFWNFEGSRDGVVRDSLPCRRHCPLPRSGLRRRRGLEIVDEFVDTGVSGAKSSRPARDLLLEADGLRQVGLVLCWRLDRRGRSVNDTVDTLRLLAGYGSTSWRSARA